MKKLIMIITVAMLLVLAGCAKTNVDAPTSAPVAQEPAADSPSADSQLVATAPAPSEPVPSSPRPAASSTKPYDAPAIPPAAEPTPTSSISPDAYADSKVASLVKKAASKVDSYSFLYQSSDNWDVIRDKYFIKGNKLKIDLYDVNLYNKRNYFDAVYLDMNSKSGVAYCEDRHNQRCLDQEREFEIAYEDFMIRTPRIWMATMPAKAMVVGSETFDKRLASVIEYTQGGVTVRIWADTFSGLPMQVIVYEGEIENTLEKYGYRDLSVNSVKAADVEHV